MKKFILTSLILFAGFLFINLQAQIFSIEIKGQVTDVVTGAPIANHNVHITTDSASSVFFYHNTVTTDYSGHYKDIVQIPISSQILFYIYTFDCSGNIHNAVGVSTNAPIINNFAICGQGGNQCIADFHALPDSLNPFAYHFIDMSMPIPDTWAWDFGDGTTSSLQNPYHTYNAPGVYQVCLTITKGTPGTTNFCQDSFCKDVIVNNSGNCQNDFQYIVNNLTVEFLGNANPPTSSYNWDFGDGTYGTAQNEIHTYAAPGMYQVTLTTSTFIGCTYTSTKMVHVTGANICDPVFLAVHMPGNPNTFEFIDMSMGNPQSWYWEFGDGNSSTLQNPIHTYSTAGIYLVCLTIICDPNGTSATYCDTIVVSGGSANCHAMFDVLQDSLNVLGFQFLDQSLPAPPDTWAWDFGDGSTSGAQNPFHFYNAPGKYNVCLTITTGVPGTTTFCSDTYCHNVFVDTVPIQCHNNFQYSANNLIVDFFGMAIPQSSTYAWGFGDGSSDIGQNVVHTYASPGIYTVTLVTTDPLSGCTFTRTKNVQVQGTGICDPMFIILQGPIIGMSYQFLDASMGNPMSWSWDFGDGSTSTLQNPMHIYTAPGLYLVCLTITCNPNTPPATFCDSIMVTGNPPNCDNYFTTTVSNLTVVFEGFTNSTAYTYYMWDFGFGATGSGQTVTHTFPQAGKYHVCLTTVDSNNCTFTSCKNIHLIGGNNCNANFHIYPDSSVMYGFSFMDASQPAPVDTWAWDFGDGNTSSLQNPYHVYNAAGVYQVCLTITKGNPATGTFCTDTYCNDVVIDTIYPCHNDFQFAVMNLTVDFFGMAFPISSSYSWDFGDGNTGLGQNVVHTYAAPGMYQVSLTTSNFLVGCTFTSTKLVHVVGSGLCDPMFLAMPQSIPNQTLDFTDISSGNPVSWYWDFGDGSNSTLQHPSHQYSAPGLYLVCLTIICDTNMIPSTYCDSITVNGSPTSCHAMFYYHPDSVFQTGFFFIDASQPLPDTWLWDFGDGTTSNVQNPYHVYNAPGAYNVCLTITKGVPGTTNFCQDTYCENVFVDTIPPTCHNNFQYTVSNLTVDFFGVAMPQNSTFEWDFGDGNSGIGQNVVHTYAAPGMYLVTLITTDPFTGCSFANTKNVHVGGPGLCDPMFNIMPFPINNMKFHFHDMSNGFPVSWYWDFGDGTHSIKQNPIHTYNAPGLYLVCLTIVCNPNLPPVTYCDSLYVNSNPAPGMIHGSITMGFGFADYAKVFLIEFDPVTNTLSAIDTVYTKGNMGMMGYYEFQNVQPGTYLVKAALTPNSVAYNDFMPTYYVNTLWWDYATDVVVYYNSVMVDINLIAGSNPGGPGFIGGNVSQGANKLLGPGDAIPDVEILLLSMNDDPHLYTYSDVSGDYGFSNLAYGTYKVWAEVMGKVTDPAIVTIDANNPNITDINLIVNSTNVTASVDDNISAFVENISDIYPNPVDDIMNVEISFKLPTELHLEVFNQIGQMVYSKTVEESTGQQIIKINTSDLDGGVYSLRITTEDNAQIMRKFVKIN